MEVYIMNYVFFRPSSLSEVLELKNQYKSEASILAGGTDLVVNLKSGMINPKYIITTRKAFQNRTPIYEEDNQLIIEGNATLNDIENNFLVKKLFPELKEAVSLIGSKQIRNYATLIGNVCNASPAADSLPPLLVNNSEIVLQSIEGSRKLKLKDFLRGPRKSAIRNNEVATQIIITKENQIPKYSKYHKLTRTHAVDISGLGICIKMYTVNDVKIALGAVAPTCIRCSEAETIISKMGLLYLDASDLADLISNCASPISDLRASKEFRVYAIKHYAKKMLLECQDILKKE